MKFYRIAHEIRSRHELVRVKTPGVHVARPHWQVWDDLRLQGCQFQTLGVPHSIASTEGLELFLEGDDQL